MNGNKNLIICQLTLITYGSNGTQITTSMENTISSKLQKMLLQNGKRTDFVRPPSARPEKGTISCFFGNLPHEVDESMIKKFCSDVGEIKCIRWLEDAKTGEFKGAGFCDFADSDTVDRIVKLKNGRKLGGRIIRVDYAPNTKTKHTTKKAK